jgi:hypothetical protein
MQICFRKDLHQLLPISLVTIAPRSHFFLCQSFWRKANINYSQFLLAPILQSVYVSLFFRYLPMPIPSCKKLTPLCSLFLSVQILFPQAYTLRFLPVPICFCNSTFDFLSLFLPIRLNVTSTCATLHQQALYLSDI